MTVLVGEVWVALRPEMTSFGSDVRKELGKIINPSGQAGLGGLLNKVGALSLAGLVTASAVSAKFAADQQVSQARLQGTMHITEQAARAIGEAFLSTGGESTFSGNEMMAAFAPVGGQLAALNGQVLTTRQSLDFMTQSGVLAEATGVDLSSTTQILTNVLQAFQLKTSDAAGAVNTLYTVSTQTGVPLTTLGQVLGQLHMRLGDLVPNLTDVGTLMVDLAHHGTVGSRGVRAVTSGLEHLIVEAGKAGPKASDAVAKASAKITAAQDALQRANLAYAAKQASYQTSGGAYDTSRQYALAAAQLRVTEAAQKLTTANQGLAAAQAGLNAPTNSATELLKQWGVSLFNTQGKFIGMRNLIATLGPHIEALRGQARNSALALLFGAGAAQQFGKVIAAGVPAYDKAQAAVRRHNAAVQAAAAYQKTLEGQMKVVKAALYDVATQFGTLLVPALTDVAKVLTKVTEFFVHNKGAAEALGIVVGTVLGAAMLHYVGSVSVKFVNALKGDLQGILKLAGGVTGGAQRVTLASGEYKDSLGRMHAANGKFIASTPELEAAFAEEEASMKATAGTAAETSDGIVVSAAKQVGAWVKTAAASTISAAKQVGSWIAVGAAATASAAKQVAAWIASGAEAVVGAAIQVGAWAAVAAAAVAAFIAENIATLGIIALIAALVAAIVWMATHWKQTWNFIKSIALDVWHFLDNDVIHPIAAAFSWVVNEIKAHWDLLLPIFLGPIGLVLLAWRHFHKQIVDGIKDIVEFFIKLPGRILNAVIGFGSLLLHAGEALMKGLVHGIIHGLDNVRHTIAHVADNVVGWVTSGFGIFSPSRRMREVGKRLPEGLALGILDNSHLVKNAIRGLTDGVQVPGIHTAINSGAQGAQHQLLVAMRQLITETRQNTAAVHALTIEERKPIKATITKGGPGGRGGHGGAGLAMLLAR